MLSGTQLITTLAAGSDPYAVGVNQTTGCYVYVVNNDSNDVTVLSGAGNVTTLSGGAFPQCGGCEPDHWYVYVANQASNGCGGLLSTRHHHTRGGHLSQCGGCEPDHGYIYVANLNSNDVTVLSGTEVITTARSRHVSQIGSALKHSHRNVYVANYGSNNVTVLSGY